MLQKFRNRTEAGKLLAAQLTEYAHCPDILVLGLPVAVYLWLMR